MCENKTGAKIQSYEDSAPGRRIESSKAGEKNYEIPSTFGIFVNEHNSVETGLFSWDLLPEILMKL